MTPAERRKLEDKRQQMEMERLAGMAKMNQAIGAIAMLDAMLQLPHEAAPEVPAEAPQAA
jgi:hypothetical protein